MNLPDVTSSSSDEPQSVSSVPISPAPSKVSGSLPEARVKTAKKTDQFVGSLSGQDPQVNASKQKIAASLTPANEESAEATNQLGERAIVNPNKERIEAYKQKVQNYEGTIQKKQVNKEEYKDSIDLLERSQDVFTEDLEKTTARTDALVNETRDLKEAIDKSTANIKGWQDLKTSISESSLLKDIPVIGKRLNSLFTSISGRINKKQLSKLDQDIKREQATLNVTIQEHKSKQADTELSNLHELELSKGLEEGKMNLAHLHRRIQDINLDIRDLNKEISSLKDRILEMEHSSAPFSEENRAPLDNIRNAHDRATEIAMRLAGHTDELDDWARKHGFD